MCVCVWEGGIQWAPVLDIKCTSGFIANERFLGSYRLQNEGSLLIVPTF